MPPMDPARILRILLLFMGGVLLTAALYATHGVLVLVAASDVRRYLGLVRAIGATVLGVDVQAGMPTWWTLAEGPPIAAAGVLVYALAGRVPGVRSRW